MVVVDVVHENAIAISLLKKLEAIIATHAHNVSRIDVRLARKSDGDDDDADEGIIDTAEFWFAEQENRAWRVDLTARCAII